MKKLGSFLILSGLLAVAISINCENGKTNSKQGIVGDIGQPARINIVNLQQGDITIHGTANNIDINKTKVVLWAKTDQWYVQPWTDNPYTTIDGNGNWWNTTHPWQRILALLVDPSRYNPGATREYHPASDSGVLAFAEYPESSTDRYITFGDYRWRIKNADMAGPGPNHFSDSTDNIWTDDRGLHLKIVSRNGNWYCSEAILDHSLGYGTYTFQLASRVDSLDYHAVFAGFVYESVSREIDIEFSRALANPYNAQYVVQPYNHSGNLTRFDASPLPSTSYQFVWQADSIFFVCWNGWSDMPQPGDIIRSWTYSGNDIPPPGGERMRFNLWLYNGHAPINKGDEVIIESFSFNP